MVVRIAVIGGGINGLACAVKIKEKYNNAEVVLISSEFSPNTTGDGSAGLWYPYLCGDTPRELLSKWGCETYNFLHQRWLEGGHGICLMPIYSLYRDKARWAEPLWANNVFGYHNFNKKELEYYNRLYSGQFVAGHIFSTFTFWPPPFLSYLQGRFEMAKGQVIQATVESLQDSILSAFDVVVNCTGLNARKVVPDGAVFPYRGQVIRVKAPWMMDIVMDEDGGNYIIPNADTCVMGGTRQQNDYNTTVYEKDTADIVDGCEKLKPSIKSAEICSQWVGLRPGRQTVRLEAEQKNGKLIIHNYGHGGCGLTLFWGCATDVVQLLDNYMGTRIKDKCKL